jgi:hypothetical protein
MVWDSDSLYPFWIIISAAMNAADPRMGSHPPVENPPLLWATDSCLWVTDNRILASIIIFKPIDGGLVFIV